MYGVYEWFLCIMILFIPYMILIFGIVVRYCSQVGYLSDHTHPNKVLMTSD